MSDADGSAAPNPQVPRAVNEPAPASDGVPSNGPPMRQRVVLVTGGGRGIGAAIARSLARAGHPVAVAARSKAQIEAVADRIRSEGGTAHAATVDVRDPDAVGALVDDVTSTLGAPLVVVNNAGVADSHKLAGHPHDLWHRTLAVNLTGPYLVTRACCGAMLEAGWGRVVNVGSVASLRGARYIAAYTAAKHGLLGLTRALAAEWVTQGITVNLVAPGYVDTPMTESTVENIVERTGRDRDAALSAVTSLSPQRRLVEPDEVAAVVALLVSDAGRSITGATYPIDGGASAVAGTG